MKAHTRFPPPATLFHMAPGGRRALAAGGGKATAWLVVAETVVFAASLCAVAALAVVASAFTGS